jgi:hypothetical protein
VYNIEALPAKNPSDVVGGATRFAGKIKSFAAENPLILFSGEQSDGARALPRARSPPRGPLSHV